MAEQRQGKVIHNVGMLDLRSVSEETVAQIRRIGNVGVLLHSPETAGLVVRLNIGNIGSTIEAPHDARLLNGQQVLGAEAFQGEGEPLRLLINGQAIIRPEVTVEEIARGLGDLWLNGQLLCPEHLAGAVQAKLRQSNGKFQIYKKYPKLIVGNLTLDEAFLRSLEDGASMVVVGNLEVPEVLPNDLLEQQIGQLQVIGRLVCREENKQALLSRQEDLSAVKMTVIPAGYVPVEKPLFLDADMLEALPGRKLYCTQAVQLAPEVTAEALAAALDSLVVRGLLLCPAALKKAVARLCNLLETQTVFYEGTLWLVEDEETLRASRFDYAEKGKTTLVVTGELTVEAEVSPQVLAERLLKVHNFGEISCTSEQMGALQARLGVNQGEFVELTQAAPAVEEQPDEDCIGNAGYLKL